MSLACYSQYLEVMHIILSLQNTKEDTHTCIANKTAIDQRQNSTMHSILYIVIHYQYRPDSNLY